MANNIKSVRYFLVVCIGVLFLETAHGHGMLLDPVGRASRWRYDSSAPINYDDNALYCGGYYYHWTVNGGKCGLCGDDYALSTPRPHELGGKYGAGTIVATYQSGNIIRTGVQITASHLGYFYFELCNLDGAGYEFENCFVRLLLENGSDRYTITSQSPAYYETAVQLPVGVACTHCVFRWTYVAGNNWGICENGVGALGCGPQETFKSCADITINGSRTTFEDNVIVDERIE